MSPLSTVIIMSVFLFVYAILIPILNSSEKFGKYISLRWYIVILYLALALGVTIDFYHIENSTRLAVIIGSFALAFVYVLMRSFEKKTYNSFEMETKFKDLENKITIKDN